MTIATQIDSDRMPQLNPTALALAFGVAGLTVVALFAAVMGGMSGMMGGSAGWMHGSGSAGQGYGGLMMGGWFGFFVPALVYGFLGGALAGGVSAAVYNYVVGRHV